MRVCHQNLGLTKKSDVDQAVAEILHSTYNLELLLTVLNKTVTVLDECQLNQDNCHTNAVCTDTKTGYYCTCKPGYIGNGRECGMYI